MLPNASIPHAGPLCGSAIESLLFVGADVYIETYGYTRGNYMRGCFPYGSRANFGVSYGRACSWKCHEQLHLLPPPTRRCRRDD